MTDSSQPAVTVTQSKIAFVLSLIAVAGFAFAGTNKVVRYQVEFETLKESYLALAEGQSALQDEVKSLRNSIDGEVRHLTQAINGLTKMLEGDQR